MSLSAALAQIQRPSWLAEAPPDWASNAARNARYAAEREALRGVLVRAINRRSRGQPEETGENQ